MFGDSIRPNKWGKDCAPKKTKEKGDVHFFAMVIYYEKFQLFCVVHFQLLLTFCSKCIWGFCIGGIIIICPNPPYCNLHTQSWKETSNGFKMGFTFAIWRGYIAPRLSLTIALSFYDNFSQLGFHDIKRLQFSVRGGSDQISPLHCKCLIFQPMLDWIDSNVCPVVL